MSTRPKPPAEFPTRERCFITELLNREALPSVSVARARVEPGVTTERHALDVEEWYVVESGAGIVRIGAAPPRRVGPGDHVRIPPGDSQQVTNPGPADLLFFCVCTPRFTPEAYRPLEREDE